MAKAQVKCPGCQQWVDANINACPSCQSILDRNELLKQEREAAQPFSKKAEKVSRIDLFIERSASSKNPFVILSRYIVMGLWYVYLSFLAFVIWFVTLLVG